MIIVAKSSSKSFQNGVRPHENENLAFSNSFKFLWFQERFRFRD